LIAEVGSVLLISGDGDVIEPDDGVAAIGSGAPYATAAARALLKHTELGAREIALSAMEIAAELCIYTNGHFSMEWVAATEDDSADEAETDTETGEIERVTHG
jgi:ATP-dependent HslUV protease subunit HslV